MSFYPVQKKTTTIQEANQIRLVGQPKKQESKVAKIALIALLFLVIVVDFLVIYPCKRLLARYTSRSETPPTSFLQDCIMNKFAS